MTSCSNEKQEESLSFALLINSLYNSWTKGEIEGFQDACDELGVKAVIFDNELDANTTLSNMDVVLERGVDGIVISPPDQKISALIVDKAFSVDVPVISLDLRLLDYDNRQLAPHVGIQSEDAGSKAGIWLAKELVGSGWLMDETLTVGVAEIAYEEIWDLKIRTDTLRAVLRERASGLTDSQFYTIEGRSTDITGGLLSMHEIINSHPEVTNWIIYGGAEEGVIGAVRALEQLGMAENALACGIGMGLTLQEYKKVEPTSYRAAVGFSAYDQGHAAAGHLFRYVMMGEPIPAFTEMESRIYTRDEIGNLNE